MDVIEAIGNTPLIELKRVAAGLPVKVYIKCEHLNPGGSVKDRTARAIILDAEQRGQLGPGSTIIEGTAGNTGVGLALLASARGYRCICVLPEKMAIDKRIQLRQLGSEVIITRNGPLSSPVNFRNVAARLAEENGWLLTNQFHNPANLGAHYGTPRFKGTGEEICDQMAAEIAGRGQYSRSLLRLASLLIESAPARTAHALGIFDSNTLERRLMKLADHPSEIRGLRRFAAVAACLALGAATCASALALRMQVNSTEASGNHPTAHPAKVNVSPEIMQNQIIYKVIPKYPVEAKKARIQGKVVLNAVIGKDGSVTDLKVDSGPKELRQSSLDAVKQWKYKPYLLNGQPVAVKTTINITYTLAEEKK